MRHLLALTLLVTLPLLALAACSSKTQKGQGDGSTEDGATEDGATDDGATEDGATEDGATDDGATDDGATEDGDVTEKCPGGEAKLEETACAGDGLVYGCGNGCDDDGDGLYDADDPDCSSPCDEDEEDVMCDDGSVRGQVTRCPSDGLIYVCGNGCDDDEDGQTDLADANCESNPCHVSEATTESGGNIVPCGGSIFQCADGVDNDGDGLADSNDPDCLGPCDNNESGLNANIPGGGSGTGSCTLDCYFDENSGSGGGDCEWHVGCDSLNPGEQWPGSDCSYIGDGNDTASGGFSCSAHYDDQFGERANCEDDCEWRTPNGCDCFGCCLFPTESQPNRYLLTPSRDPDGEQRCTFEDAQLEDPVHCQPCTPVPSCLNECGECELCVGKDTLPEHCSPPPPPTDGGVADGGVDGGTDGGEEPPPRCPGGEQPCGLEGDDPCGPDFYCLTGCCVFFGGPG